LHKAKKMLRRCLSSFSADESKMRVFAQHTFYSNQGALTVAPTPPVFSNRDRYVSLKYQGKLKFERKSLFNFFRYKFILQSLSN
jgi:rRNA maturation protein Nop10